MFAINFYILCELLSSQTVIPIDPHFPITFLASPPSPSSSLWPRDQCQAKPCFPSCAKRILKPDPVKLKYKGEGEVLDDTSRTERCCQPDTVKSEKPINKKEQQELCATQWRSTSLPPGTGNSQRPLQAGAPFLNTRYYPNAQIRYAISNPNKTVLSHTFKKHPTHLTIGFI